MKKENFKWAVLSVIAAFSTGILIGCMYVSPVGETKSYKDVGGNIDIEYYLEVSEDSIWVEGVQSKKVYSGTYADLDSLIIQDNL